MFKSEKVYLIAYFIIIILSAILRISPVQNMLLIISSFLLNLAIIKKLDIKSNKYKYFSFGIIIVNIILIYIKYYNSIHLGFAEGLPLGQIGKSVYNDSYGYYYQSITLSDLWLNGGFKDWLSGKIPNVYVGRGIYNYFLVFNSCIRVLFGENLITWMLIKYQFSIISIALMYKISNNFLEEKYSILALILFNFYPGYLLVNNDLLRDNFISLFIILTCYIAVKDKNNKKIEWIKIIILLAITTYIRSYMGIILAVSLFVYFSIENFNLRSFITYLFIFTVLAFIIGKVMEFWGYGFLGLDLIRSGDIESVQWNSESVNTPIKLVIKTLYLVFAGQRPTIGSGGLDFILEVYNNFASIFIIAISLPTLMALIFFKMFNKQQRNFIVFTFVFALLSGLIITYGFSAIIPRLYICWFWSQCIVFAMFLSNCWKLGKAQSMVLKLEYVIFILFIFVGFVKYTG